MTIPKLSEAILQGYNESAQANFRFVNTFWLDKEGDHCAGCALGLAFWAMGHEKVCERVFELLNQYWPWTIGLYVSGLDFATALSFKFEDVLQSRITMEELIEWVKQIEPKEEAVTPEPVLVACEV